MSRSSPWFQPGSSRTLVVLVLVLCIMHPGSAIACTLDNTASLSANGVRATFTTDAPVRTRAWAPFTVEKAFASRSPVYLIEAHADLERSLPPALLASPFRWTFGDGATVIGRIAVHRYTYPGVYRISVAVYVSARHQWVSFDSALLRIVLPDQTLQANLGYYMLWAFDRVFSSVTTAITIMLGVLLLYILGSSLWNRTRLVRR